MRGPIPTLYVRELRSAMRERSLVVYTVLLPLLLYPVMLWVGITAVSFISGQSEQQTARVVAVGLEHADDLTEDALEGVERIDLRVSEAALDDELEALRREEIDVVAHFQPARGDGEKLAGNFAVELHFSAARGRSNDARGRVEDALAEYRADRLEREVVALGVDADAFRQFEIERKNVASEEDMGAFLLGELLPVTILVMIGMGAIYPAIDAVAGERERSTWETSLTLGVSRRSLVVAKYLYVSTLGTVAGLLNIAGIVVALGAVATRLVPDDKSLEIAFPIAAVPVVMIGTILLALTFGALMMITAAFARTYKEGQSLAGPIFMVLLLPLLVVGLPDESIGLGFATVPVVNMMLLFKQVLVGDFQPAFIAVTLGSSVLAVAACLWVAAKLLQNETLVLGAFQGTPSAFLRSLLRRESR